MMVMTITCSGATRVQRHRESHREALAMVFVRTEIKETTQRLRITGKQGTSFLEEVLFLKDDRKESRVTFMAAILGRRARLGWSVAHVTNAHLG